MKKLIASALVLAVAIAAAPINLIAAARVQAQGVISGIASVDGKALANVTVRVRNLDTNQLVGEMQANQAGQFSFSGLGAGNFVVETVAANGTILGTSATIALAAGAMTATGVAVATSGTALAAAGGVGGAAAAAAAGGAAGAVGGGLGGVALAAIGGGVIAGTAGIISANNGS